MHNKHNQNWQIKANSSFLKGRLAKWLIWGLFHTAFVLIILKSLEYFQVTKLTYIILISSILITIFSSLRLSYLEKNNHFKKNFIPWLFFDLFSFSISYYLIFIFLSGKFPHWIISFFALGFMINLLNWCINHYFFNQIYLKYIHHKKLLKFTFALSLPSVIFILSTTYDKIPVSSGVGRFLDLVLFFGGCVILFSLTWYSLRWIDHLSMHSDLHIWGLRIVGGILAVIAFCIFFMGAFTSLLVTFMSGEILFANFLVPLLGICLGALGAFCEYRSFRHTPAIHIFQN